MPAPVQLGPDRELEDAEIAILNEIVAKAAVSSDADTHPWRSLHRAYQEVLAHHDIVDERPDGIYLRFLFLLRERQVRSPIPTLFAHFQQILRENGIEIQIGDDDSSLDVDEDYSQTEDYTVQDEEEGEGGRGVGAGVGDGVYNPSTRRARSMVSEAGDVTIALERFGRPAHEIAKAAQQWMPTPLRRRRASLESAYDATGPEEIPEPNRRRASFSQVEEDTKPLSRGGGDLKAVNGHPPRPWEASMIANASSPSRLSNRSPVRSTRPQSQITLLDEPEDFHYWNALLKSREASLDASRARPAGYAEPVAAAAASRPLRKPSSQATVQRRTSRSARDEVPVRAVEYDFGPPNARLQSTAKAFDAARVQELSRDVFHLWYRQTFGIFKRQQELELRAADWDARQLKRDTLKIWSAALQELRHEQAQKLAEERRFAVLEQRAQDARDTNLLTKAFHHWAACAADETERATKAKQHLIRFRYFQAWQDYTVANEFKVRRFGLQIWFSRWHTRSAKQTKTNSEVRDYNEDMLIRRSFHEWLWMSRERQFKRHQDALTKRRIFDLLLVKLRNVQESQLVITQARQRAALQSLQKLREAHDEASSDAFHFDRRRLLFDAMSALTRQQQLSVRGRKVAMMVDWRIASRTMERLQYVAGLQQRARAVDRGRLLQNALFAWNSGLREQVLAKRINDRILTATLYQWVLAERRKLFERLRTERLMQRCMIMVMDSRAQQSTGLASALVAYRKAQKDRILRSALRAWWNRTRANLRLEGAAVATHERQLKQTALDMFADRYERVQVLETQYLPNAELWFRGRSTLKQWKEACKRSRTKKRHEAYVVVRRQVKQNLVRSCLRTWREKSTDLTGLQQMCRQFIAQNLSSMSTDIFRDWQENLQERESQERQAIELDRASLLRRALVRWRAETSDVQDKMAVALEHDSEHAKRTAYVCLRTLHFRISSIQDLYTSRRAADQIEWNRRRRHRALLRKWLEATQRRRDPGIPATTAQARRFKNFLSRSQLRDSTAAAAAQVTAVPPAIVPSLSRIAATLALDDEASMTPAIPPPTTPSRRRFARPIRTPAPPPPLPPLLLQPRASVPLPPTQGFTAASSEATLVAEDQQQQQQGQRNPFTGSLQQQQQQQQQQQPAATESRLPTRQARPFGKSTARVLFKPLPRNASESFP